MGRYLESIVKEVGNVEVVRPQFFKFFWPHWLKSLTALFAYNLSELWISHLLPLGYAALIYKKLTGTPYTIFVHGTDIQFAKKSAWKLFWVKIILNQADLIVANSQFTLSLIKNLKFKNFPPKADQSLAEKFVIIYPCSTFNPETISVNKKAHSLLSVGRLVPRKGFEQGIEAAIELKKEFTDLTYTIIGSGAEEEKLKNLISKNNANAYIKIITNADDAALQDYYAQNAILLAPGQEIDGDVEGFGLVIVEAAQFGTPTVATNIGGVGEAIVDGQTGILIPDNQAETLVSAVSKLFKDNESRRQMGQAAKQRVEREFNMKEQVSKIFNV